MLSHLSAREWKTQMALRMAKAKADEGKPSSFKRWWYFDTNCLSELVKENQKGNAEAVTNLISGKDVLISNTILAEMRKRPDLLVALEEVLEAANPFLLSDLWKFWDADVVNFLNVQGIAFNALDVYPLPSGLLAGLTQHQGFSEASNAMEAELDQGFLSGLAPDIASKMDERDLCMVIWSKVTQHAKRYANIDIPGPDVTPEAFPSFYVYFYTYYFRFMKQDFVAPEPNDALDLTNSLPMPYCERYYGERKFTNVLKRIQGHQPPSLWALCTRAYKRGLIDYQTYRVQKEKKGKLGRTYPMLLDMCIFNFGELREHLQA